MKKLALSTLALLALVGGTSAAFADAKWDKDNAPQLPQTRATLDCSNAIDAGCGFTYSGSNGSGTDIVTNYACFGFTEDGPEVVFALTLAATSNVDIVMDTSGGDLDLVLLGSCDENDCIAGSASIEHEEIHVKCLPAGTYYVVVDGYAGTIDNFTISMNCTTCSEPAGNETCGSALELGCGDIALTTDTSGSNNDYQLPAGNACTGYSSSGGDLVWTLCIPAGGTMDLTFAENDYDASVYVVTDCANPVGTCLDGDDCYPYPCNDILYYNNTGGTDINAYLIVDGFGGETGHGVLTGTVDCCGGTATRTTTWGGLKKANSR